MTRLHRRVCQTCRVVFVPEIEEQIECYRCLLSSQERKIKNEYQQMRKDSFRAKIKSSLCKFCGKEFYCSQRSKQKTCSTDCRYLSQSFSRSGGKGRSRIHEEKTEEMRIKEENEKWLLGEKKKKGRTLPLEVLDKMAEKKRVWDDSGWNHFIKGRKWDRI